MAQKHGQCLLDKYQECWRLLDKSVDSKFYKIRFMYAKVIVIHTTNRQPDMCQTAALNLRSRLTLSNMSSIKK